MVLKETVLRAVAKAEIAIQDLKIVGLLTRRVPTAHVPGQVPAPSTTTSPISVVITSFETQEIDGDRIKASDLKGLVFPNDSVMVPDADDIVTTYAADGETITANYRVIYNDKVMAGDTVALSQLHMRLK